MIRHASWFRDMFTLEALVCLHLHHDSSLITLSILGRNIAEIPCFRDSYLYGICTGIAGGFGYFMFTSKPKVSTHFGMATLCVSTLAYWSYCRWNYHDRIKEAAIMKSFLLDKLTKEGTGIDPKNEDVIGIV